MKHRAFAFLLILILLLPGCRKETEPPPAPSLDIRASFEPPYETTTYSIRHTTLDPKGRNLSVFFEVPVFQENIQGYQQINGFFNQMEEEFFSSDNAELSSFWEEQWLHTGRYEHRATVLTQTQKLVCVQISVSSVKARAFEWTDSYTFDVITGERLTLSELVDDPEGKALSILFKALDDSEYTDLPWGDIEERTLNDFDFYIENDTIYLAFDPYEAAMGATGSFSIPLPVTLKPEWRSDAA